MSRSIRLSLALLFALMMVIATASAALAFDPGPNSNVDGLCGLNFPAVMKNQAGLAAPLPNGGPWNATINFNPAGVGAVDFGTSADC
jgi:hypothetical protein